MAKRVKNSTLVIVLLVLVGAYVISELVSPDKERDSTLKTDLIDLDTAKVDRLVVGEATLVKSEGEWAYQVNDNRSVPTRENVVKNALGRLVDIQPRRLVTRDEDKWSDFQVDSTGTRVQAFSDDKKTLDLMIGRLEMVNQRQYDTYVRLYQEPEVYVTEGFLGSQFNSSPAAWRVRTITDFSYSDTLMSVAMDFNRGDSSYALKRTDQGWMVNGNPADSAEAADYIQGLKRLTSPDFVDQIDRTALKQPFAEVEVTNKSNKVARLRFYRHPEHGEVVVSSENEAEVFQAGDLKDKVLKAKGDFIP